MTTTARSPFRRRAPNLSIVRNIAAPKTMDVLLYDEIGFWGVTAKDFMTEWAAIDAETIHLRINSPGGDVFDGIAIANAVRNHPAHVVTHIDGLAASAASIVALAGKEVRMADNALLMIHNAWTLAMGDATEMMKTAGTLNKIDGSLVADYVRRTGATAEQVRAWMNAETWFNAEEALASNFIDAMDSSTTDEQAAVEDALAEFDLSVFAHTPDQLIAARRSEPTKRDAERALRDAGFSRREAKAIAAAVGKTPDPERDAPDAVSGAVLSAGAQLLATLNSR